VLSKRDLSFKHFENKRYPVSSLGLRDVQTRVAHLKPKVNSQDYDEFLF